MASGCRCWQAVSCLGPGAGPRRGVWRCRFQMQGVIAERAMCWTEPCPRLLLAASDLQGSLYVRTPVQ